MSADNLIIRTNIHIYMLISRYILCLDILDKSDGHEIVSGDVGIELHVKALVGNRVTHSYIDLKHTYMVVYVIMKLPRPYWSACQLTIS